MTHFFAIAIITLSIFYLWYWFAKGRFQTSTGSKRPAARKKGKKFRPGEMWVQVFETAAKEEAQVIQMRLEEENISVTIFEQAKKGIDGEKPAGIGVVVPKDQSGYAQQLIFRYLEHLDQEEKKPPPAA